MRNIRVRLLNEKTKTKNKKKIVSMYIYMWEEENMKYVNQ